MGLNLDLARRPGGTPAEIEKVKLAAYARAESTANARTFERVSEARAAWFAKHAISRADGLSEDERARKRAREAHEALQMAERQARLIIAEAERELERQERRDAHARERGVDLQERKAAARAK